MTCERPPLVYIQGEGSRSPCTAFTIAAPSSIARALIAELEEQARWGAGSPRAPRQCAADLQGGACIAASAKSAGASKSEAITGAEVVQANAFLVDQLVRCIYDFANTRVYPCTAADRGDEQMAVAATGGYGRGELAPFSDIDVMFLLSGQKTARLEQIVEYVLYMLWDSGLQVGHATRSVDDCVRLAKGDLSIRTSLLEARWLWGETALFCVFEQRFRNEVVAGSGAAFVEQKLAERDARHERMGDSRYVLEPHIKEGKGGLRDLQTLVLDRQVPLPGQGRRRPGRAAASSPRPTSGSSDAPRTSCGPCAVTCTTSPAGRRNG